MLDTDRTAHGGEKKRWILGKMDGDMHKAWETLDADKVTFVSREKFVGAVEGLGDFEGDATKVLKRARVKAGEQRHSGVGYHSHTFSIASRLNPFLLRNGV